MRSSFIQSQKPARARRRTRSRSRGGARGEQLLLTYLDRAGERHELLTWSAAAGSTLVLDRGPRGASPLLLAHLTPDEPPENALIVCEDYLRRAEQRRAACRMVTAADLDRLPGALGANPRAPRLDAVSVPAQRTSSGDGLRLCVQPVPGAIAQLRWWHSPAAAAAVSPPEVPGGRAVSLRDAVAVLEEYEPLRAMTRQAIASTPPGEGLSTTMLRAELARVERSPIILNRALREAVLAVVERGELSMSEIAIRCGRVKRDPRGNESGETSWLARRLGLLPEGGQSTPTPWVHSEVLGLIARHGIGLAPREVEL
jgi:hypothetical protein